MVRIRSPFAAAVAGSITAAVFLVAILVWLPETRREDLVIEIAKAAIQVFPLVFFGVIVADQVRRRDEGRALQRTKDEQQRELEQRRDEYRQRFLNDVIVAYNRTKAIRRTLQGAGLGPAAVGPMAEAGLRQLDLQIPGLSEAQLDFERLKREAEYRGSVFSRADQVRGALRKLEQYVNLVIKDWRDGRWKIPPGEGISELTAWPRYRAFLAGSDEGGDFQIASAQMDAIAEAISADLVG